MENIEKNKKKGRPKKQVQEKKTIVQSLRYTQKEWDDLKDKLDESGLSYSKFMRRAAKRTKVVKFEPLDFAILRDVRIALVRIGQNINVIAKHAATLNDLDSYGVFLSDIDRCKILAGELENKLLDIQNSLKI